MKLKQNNFYIILIIVLILIGITNFYWGKKNQTNDQIDYKNISYQVDEQVIKLINGKAEIEITPGSASKQIIQYFGNEATGDLNNDGKIDTAFLLTQNNGGSGTFYYIVVALSTNKGYQGTNAIFLGDRIAPQTTKIEDGKIVVNYADRKIDEPMTTKPSIGVSKYFKIVDSKLIEINQ